MILTYQRGYPANIGFVMAPCLVTKMSKGHGMNFLITNSRRRNIKLWGGLDNSFGLL